MDRLELVKKITSLAEIPFSEGEIFLEMFARKISDELASGQKIDIPGLGPVSYNKDEGGVSSVAFHTDSGELQLYLPEEQGVISYSRYNLSIGKPVLPVSGRSANFNFVFHPHENLHSLESKADRIFSSLMPSSGQAVIDDYDISTLDEINIEPDNQDIKGMDITSKENIFGEDNEDIFDELVDSTIDEINEVRFDDEDTSLTSLNDDADDFFKKLEEIESSSAKDLTSSDDLSEITIDDISENAFGEVENIEIVTEDIKNGINFSAEETLDDDKDLQITDENISLNIASPPALDPEENEKLLSDVVEPLSSELEKAVAHDIAVWEQHLKEDDEPLSPELEEAVAHDIAVWKQHLSEDEEPLTPEEMDTFSKLVSDDEEIFPEEDSDKITIQEEDEFLSVKDELVQQEEEEIVASFDNNGIIDEFIIEEVSETESLSDLAEEQEDKYQITGLSDEQINSEDPESEKYSLPENVIDIEEFSKENEIIDEQIILKESETEKISLSELVEENENLSEEILAEDERIDSGNTEKEKYAFADFVTDIEDVHEDIELADVKVPTVDFINADIKISSIEEELPSELEDIPGENILHEFSKEDITETVVIEETISPVELSDTEDTENSFGRLAEEIQSEKNSEQHKTTTDDNKIIGLITSNETPAAGEDEKLTTEHSYQRVKSLTREFFSLTDLEQQEKMLTWEFGGSDQMDTDIKSATKEFEDIVPSSDGDGFTFVKSKKSTMEWSPGSLPEIDDLTPLTGEETTEEIELNLEDNIFMSGPPTETDIDEKTPESKAYAKESLKEIKKQKKRIPPREEKGVYKREQKKSPSFIIMVGILSFISIAVIAYYYLNTGTSVPEKRTEKPLVIERNDRVPVLISNITPETTAEIKTESNLPAAETAAASLTESQQASEGDLIKVSDGIFIRNNVYYVQVSSWQTKSKADREAERYRRAGRTAELQTSQLKSGLWYKVIVGEFTSAEEAANFLKN